MTSSITIPPRSNPAAAHDSNSASSFESSSVCSLSPSERMRMPAGSLREEGLGSGERRRAERRVSLLSSSLSAQEHTVVNIGHPDGPPRLITCVRSSQGFDWNQEIFLPSHTDHLCLSPDLERKKDPVHDIVLTDDEIAGMFPQ